MGDAMKMIDCERFKTDPVYALLYPICEASGVDTEAQIAKARHMAKSQAIDIMAAAAAVKIELVQAGWLLNRNHPLDPAAHPC